MVTLCFHHFHCDFFKIKIRKLKGLGSFDDNIAARFQFALLILIAEAFRQENTDSVSIFEPVELFDPLFISTDIRVIEHHCSMRVIGINEKGMRACDNDESSHLTTYLFFMPHCPKALYNNLLYANWSLDRLSRVIIYGNSFCHLDSTMNAAARKTYSFLSDSFCLLDEMKLDDECECTNAFVDLSLNMFNVALVDNNRNSNETTMTMKNTLNQVYDSGVLVAPSYTDNEEIIQ